MKKTLQPILFITALAVPTWLLLGVVPQASVASQASENTLITVNTALPISVESANDYRFNARLEPIEQTDIYARADGYLEKRLVDIGDFVKQGDVLAVLSSPELEKQINQAKTEITRQRAIVALTDKVATRFSNLRDSGAVNATEVDEREAEKTVAVATLATYQARLEELENEFSYTTITAPFDGFITRRHVERGNRITRNDVLPLFRISRMDELRVVVDIPQTQLSRIDLHNAAQLSVSGLPQTRFTVPVARLAREIDRSNGTMRVEYALSNEQHLLTPGATAEITLTAKTQERLYRLPVNALKNIQGQSTVLWVDSSDTVQFSQVKLGRLDTRLVDILDGLNGDERVILNPNARLQAGMKVSVAQTAN